jgi:hypothetical protein
VRDVASRRCARSSAVTETTCGRPEIGIAVSNPTAGTVFAARRLDALSPDDTRQYAVSVLAFLLA